MARTSRNGAPAANFDALDNIDIDDMFADGGDDLFDGLADDLGLDQIGDITNNMGNTNAEEDNPAGAEKEEKSESIPATVEELPKRRKTKRKPKSPILLDEEEEANEARKKKSRGTKTGTSKKKNSRKDKDKDEVRDESLKSKSKLKGIGMHAPFQRPASSVSGPPTPGVGIVAAAGQFGGRQKRGHFVLPLSRANSDKQKTKSKASQKVAAATSTEAPSASTFTTEKTRHKKVSSAAATLGTPEPLAHRKTTAFAPPIPQTAFCGLAPSSSVFYPFMPALPAEPSIKNRKQYPAIDRVNSSFMAFINNTLNAAKGTNGESPVSEAENIHRLMHDTLKDMNQAGAQNSAAAAHDDKKSSVSYAIGALRQTVVMIEKPKLATDLFSACALLKRQYDFLRQNLSNMEQWCKENFSEADYSAAFGSPDAVKNQKEAGADSILSKFKKPLIRVKIKFHGFKEPKLSGPLFAFLPTSFVPWSGAASEHNKEKKTAKKRKGVSSEQLTLSAGSGIIEAAEKEVVIKTYPDLRSAKRRQIISAHVGQTAKELEAACIIRTASFCQAIDRRNSELKKMVEEEEVLVIHTAAMWQYIEQAGYFSDITEEALNDTLRSMWAPEVTPGLARDIPFAELSLTTRIPDDYANDSSPQIVFHGLQSLLVDESSDISDDEESEEEDERWLRDNYDEPLLSLDTTLPPEFSLVDLSGLTLDERTNMHLRRAGLLEDHPSNGLVSKSSTGGGDSLRDGAADGLTLSGTLEEVIESMSAHLIDLNQMNNARASFLEYAARTHISTSLSGEFKDDEAVALIAKCQQQLKRSKDSKTKSSTASKDEYALPW